MKQLAVLPLLLVASCSALVDASLTLPGTKVRYLGHHDSDDVAMLVHAWQVALYAHTGEDADIDGTMIEERTLSEELDGYVSDTGAVIVASKPEVSRMAIMHELTHVHLGRLYGDPDTSPPYEDHADGVGPWTKAHNEAITDATRIARKCGVDE